MSKFEENFKVLLKEPSDDTVATNCWKKIESAFKSKLAILNADRYEEADKVEEAKEKLEKAKLNNGNKTVNRDSYLNNLITLKNDLTAAETRLEEYDKTIAFLTKTYEELK